VAVAIESPPEYGEMEVEDNHIRYTLSVPFDGTGAFTYSVTDADGDRATATVTVMSHGAEQQIVLPSFEP
jgi:hypothetical protein